MSSTNSDIQDSQQHLRTQHTIKNEQISLNNLSNIQPNTNINNRQHQQHQQYQLGQFQQQYGYHTDALGQIVSTQQLLQQNGYNSQAAAAAAAAAAATSWQQQLLSNSYSLNNSYMSLHNMNKLMGTGIIGSNGRNINVGTIGMTAINNAGVTATPIYSNVTMPNSSDWICENADAREKGKRRKYCPHEVTALVMGVQKYADESCPWSSILRDEELGRLFHGRSGVDLKDKWRTLTKSRPELASYTENRRIHRKYRPFSPEEEKTLLEGVDKYRDQRNVWSLILEDAELGRKFDNRSNVQLKDKYRTMKRAGLLSGNPSFNFGLLPSNRRKKTSASKIKNEVKQEQDNTKQESLNNNVSNITSTADIGQGNNVSVENIPSKESIKVEQLEKNNDINTSPIPLNYSQLGSTVVNMNLGMGTGQSNELNNDSKNNNSNDISGSALMNTLFSSLSNGKNEFIENIHDDKHTGVSASSSTSELSNNSLSITTTATTSDIRSVNTISNNNNNNNNGKNSRDKPVIICNV